MARLGYLFLVAVLGFTVMGPSMAEAGERQGLKQYYSGGHREKPTKHAPIRQWDDRRSGHHPRDWRHQQRHVPRRWGHRHHVHRPPVRRYYYAPPVRHYGRDHRASSPYGYYSNDAGSIDFNINYRLFF